MGIFCKFFWPSQNIWTLLARPSRTKSAKTKALKIEVSIVSMDSGSYLKKSQNLKKTFFEITKKVGFFSNFCGLLRISEVSITSMDSGSQLRRSQIWKNFFLKLLSGYFFFFKFLWPSRNIWSFNYLNGFWFTAGLLADWQWSVSEKGLGTSAWHITD